MDVYVVCDIHISMTQESGNNLYIHPIVVIVCDKGVSENMFAAIFYFRFFAQFARLKSQFIMNINRMRAPMLKRTIESKAAFKAETLFTG